MKKQYAVITTDGVCVPLIKPQFSDIQTACGGYVQEIPCVFSKQPWIEAYCNENGWVEDLPYNNKASKWFGQDLAGDVVFCFNSDSQAMWVIQAKSALKEYQAA